MTDPVTRLNAALEGRYRIERQLGEGGMATVTSRAVGMLDTRPITIRAPEAQLLTTTDWQARSLAHLERAQRWTLPHKERRSRHEAHPVHDFLFQYYRYSPGKIETWHPAPTESLVESPDSRERFGPPEYRVADGVIRRDPHALSVEGRDQLSMVVNVLSATQSRPANFGCYGVHEWAMVYGGHDIRHAGVAPLRLSQQEVDRFVESWPVACSHFDAYRFFAPEAKPLNRIELEWSIRHDMEQPGCIHANMDLYRWEYTAMPWIGSDLLLDCFELAAELRVLDMQASPYDLRELGFDPVEVETTEGRSEYQRRQRELSERAAGLRAELIAVVEEVLSAACAVGSDLPSPACRRPAARSASPTHQLRT